MSTEIAAPASYCARQLHPSLPHRTRTLHFIANFVTGGSSRVVVDLIEHLGHRFDQSVVTAMLPSPAHYTGIDIIEHARFHDADEALAVLYTRRPELIHVHNVANPDSVHDVMEYEWYDQIFRATGRYATDHRCRVVQNVNIPITPYMSPAVDCYVYVSDYVRNTFGLHTAPGLTIYPGSDLERFSPETDGYAVPDDTIGMVYRLEGDKLDEHAIEPLIRAVARRPNTKALIVGGGRYLDSYRQAVHRAGLSEAFTFTGYVAYDDLPSYVRRISVFVAPVHTESFGQVSPFAMGMARPVVGYAVGALPEIIGDRSLLAPPGDVIRLSEIILQLLEDRERRVRLGALNRQRALERFSMESMIRAYANLYDSLLSSPGTFRA
jgi:glycosyltransferase involved in cell wall biosynthesis